jgi:hypothetical protein
MAADCERDQHNEVHLGYLQFEADRAGGISGLQVKQKGGRPSATALAKIVSCQIGPCPNRPVYIVAMGFVNTTISVNKSSRGRHGLRPSVHRQPLQNVRTRRRLPAFPLRVAIPRAFKASATDCSVGLAAGKNGKGAIDHTLRQ